MKRNETTYQRFLQQLEKNGYFVNCTEQQKKEKERKAELYFDCHYSTTASFVSQREGSTTVNISDEKKKQAAEYKSRGNDWLNKKAYQKAIEEYTHAIQLMEDPVFFGNRAAAEIELEQFQLAINDCTKALELDPNYGKAYGRLAVIYIRMGQLEKARDAINNGLKIDPNNESNQKILTQINTLSTENTQRTSPRTTTSHAPQQTTTQATSEPESTSQNIPPQPENQSAQQSATQSGNQQPHPNTANIPNPLGNIDISSIMNMFGGQNGGMDISQITQGIMSNPALRPFVNVAANIMGISVDEIERQMREEANGQTQGNTNTSQPPSNPPPGYL